MKASIGSDDTNRRNVAPNDADVCAIIGIVRRRKFSMGAFPQNARIENGKRVSPPLPQTKPKSGRWCWQEIFEKNSSSSRTCLKFTHEPGN